MNDLSVFFRFSAASCVASGFFLLAYWFLYVVFLPYGKITTGLSILAENPNWTWVNLLGVTGALFGVLALPGFYLRQSAGLGTIGTWSFFIALAGSALMLGPMLWDTVLWKALARHDAGILDFKGPIYQSPTFVPFFISAGLAWGVGFALLGWRTHVAGVFPSLLALLIGIGPLLFALGSMAGSLQAVVRSVGIAAFGAGFIWAGLLLWQSPSVSPTP